MRNKLLGLLSLLPLLATGCASNPLIAFERALEDAGIAQFDADAPETQGRRVVVRAEGSTGQGRGAVVGASSVLTV